MKEAGTSSRYFKSCGTIAIFKAESPCLYLKVSTGKTHPNYKGVFVAKRNEVSLKNIILRILIDYKKIQNEMKKNKIPTHKEFIESLSKFLIS